MSYRTIAALALLIACGCTRPNPAYHPGVRPPGDAAEPLIEPGPQLERPAAPDAKPPGADLSPSDLARPVDAAPAPDQGLAADAATEAPPLDGPPGTSNVDRMVGVSPGGTTSSYGGTGGTGYQDDCGAGAVLVGYRGWKVFYVGSTTSQYVIGLQALCGRLRVPAGATSVETVPDTMTSLRGRTEGQAWQALCPSGSALVGFTAQLDDGTVDNLQFRCAPLSVAPGPTGAMTIGTATALPWSGGRSGGAEMMTTCPAGQVGHGHLARVGSFLDAYQMTCGTPTVAP